MLVTGLYRISQRDCFSRVDARPSMARLTSVELPSLVSDLEHQ